MAGDLLERPLERTHRVPQQQEPLELAGVPHRARSRRLQRRAEILEHQRGVDPLGIGNQSPVIFRVVQLGREDLDLDGGFRFSADAQHQLAPPDLRAEVDGAVDDPPLVRRGQAAQQHGIAVLDRYGCARLAPREQQVRSLLAQRKGDERCGFHARRS